MKLITIMILVTKLSVPWTTRHICCINKFTDIHEINNNNDSGDKMIIHKLVCLSSAIHLELCNPDSKSWAFKLKIYTPVTPACEMLTSILVNKQVSMYQFI